MNRFKVKLGVLPGKRHTMRRGCLDCCAGFEFDCEAVCASEGVKASLT